MSNESESAKLSDAIKDSVEKAGTRMPPPKKPVKAGTRMPPPPKKPGD